MAGKLPEFNYRSQTKKEEAIIYRRIGIVVVLTFSILIALFLWGASFINSVGLLLNRAPATDPNQTSNDLLAGPHLDELPIATNSAFLDVKGYSRPNQDVELIVNDVLAGKLPASADGTFLFSTIKLREATNQIQVTTIDKNGNRSPATLTSVIFDKTPPKLIVHEPVPDLLVGSGISQIRVRGVGEPGTVVTVNGSQVILDPTGNFDTTTAIEPGANKIQITDMDTAGNQTVVERLVSGQ